MTNAKLLLIFTCVLSILWITVAIKSFNLPIYLDSLFTIGAGTQLAQLGHFSGTFMLYGLVNAYILEALLVLKLGALAPYLLRLVQLLMALTGFYFLCRSISLRNNNHCIHCNFLSAAAVVLSSSVILIESFEPTPENVMLFAVNILFYHMAVFKCNRKHAVVTGVILALLVGTRPTALILGLPVLLIIPEHYSDRAYAKKFWRWFILVIFSVAAALTSFPQLISVKAIWIISAILVLPVTLFSIIHDNRNNCFGAWRQLLLILISFTVSLLLLFPNYFLHFPELIRQIQQFHLGVEIPCGSLAVLAKSILYSILYLTIAFPGPFAAIGFFTAIGLFLSKRESMSYRILSLFAIGSVPFLLIVCRNDNFQSRYLIPLMGFYFFTASIGIRYILTIKKLRYFLLVPFLISSFQIFEIVQYKTQGGILNAFYDLSLKEHVTVFPLDIDPCNSYYYSEEDDICWPLMPYVESHLNVRNSEEALYCVSFTPPPDQYEILETYGTKHSYKSQLKNLLDNPRWTALFILSSEPWKWRGWGVVYLSRISPCI